MIAGELVAMIMPSGGSAYGISGRRYDGGPGSRINVEPEDVPSFRAAGFLEVLK